MLSVRSRNLKTYAVRMLFVILLGLAAHCVVAVAKGGEGKRAFDFGDPERRRTLLVVVLAVGAAAVVMLPMPGATTAENKPADAGKAKTERGDEPEKAAAQTLPVVRPAPVASAEPVDPPKPVEQVMMADPPAPPVPPVRSTAPSVRASVGELAERKWAMARRIRHNYIPDLFRDRFYLKMVHDAAMAGHPDAQAKLGDYAFRRRTLVEAYYWMKLSSMNGRQEAESNLMACRDKWKQKGCPPEYENVSAFFTEQQSALGRALLRLACGVRPEQALTRIRAQAAGGDDFAVRILDAMSKREDV